MADRGFFIKLRKGWDVLSLPKVGRNGNLKGESAVLVCSRQ